MCCVVCRVRCTVCVPRPWMMPVDVSKQGSLRDCTEAGGMALFAGLNLVPWELASKRVVAYKMVLSNKTVGHHRAAAPVRGR